MNFSSKSSLTHFPWGVGAVESEIELTFLGGAGAAKICSSRGWKGGGSRENSQLPPSWGGAPFRFNSDSNLIQFDSKTHNLIQF